MLAMVVRMRATRSHRNNRRSHHALSAGRASKCANCGAIHKAHTVCMSCGWYNGRKVIDLAAKVAKKAKKVEATKK
jgi:large subunit ribosomal protein L32